MSRVSAHGVQGFEHVLPVFTATPGQESQDRQPVLRNPYTPPVYDCYTNISINLFVMIEPDNRIYSEGQAYLDKTKTFNQSLLQQLGLGSAAIYQSQRKHQALSIRLDYKISTFASLADHISKPFVDHILTSSLVQNE